METSVPPALSAPTSCPLRPPDHIAGPPPPTHGCLPPSLGPWQSPASCPPPCPPHCPPLHCYSSKSASSSHLCDLGLSHPQVATQTDHWHPAPRRWSHVMARLRYCLARILLSWQVNRKTKIGQCQKNLCTLSMCFRLDIFYLFLHVKPSMRP